MWDRVATEERWVRCSRPFSFYHGLIERYWAGGPSEASAAPMHRVCTLARKMGVRSVVIEDVLGRPDVAAEIAHLEACAAGGEGAVSACAITFLACGVPRDRSLAEVATPSVIGQVVVVTFPLPDGGTRSYVYEAVWRVPGPRAGAEQLLNNHLPVRGELPLALGGAAHRLPGAYFCQQNGISSICSHSAVRTLVRTLTDAEVSVPQLNAMWDYDVELRRVTTKQVGVALGAFGLRCVPYDPSQAPAGREGSWELPALLADSGSASLLVLSDGKVAHVVPVLGHTINSDEWHPIGARMFKKGEEDVSSSSLWTDHLVIHDDLLGPYYCLSKAGLLPGREARLKPRLAMAILPQGVEVSPIQAETSARQILGFLIKSVEEQKFGRGPWWRHLAEIRERRVFRTTLIGRDEYLATLPEGGAAAGRKAQLAAAMPDRMWMAEVSVPNVFLANRAKLGEILLRTSTFPADDDPEAVLETMVGFRLPSLICWPDPDGGPRDFVFGRWPERGHRRIHAPGYHSNWW